MLKIYTRWIFYSLCLAGLIGIGVYYFPHITLFQIQEIPVEIKSSSTHQYFAEQMKDNVKAKLSFLNEQNVWLVSLKKIYEQVSSESWIESINLKRVFPNRLKIDIKSKEIIFVFVNQKNEFIPILEDGLTVPAQAANLLPDVPVLRIKKNIFNEETLKKITALMKLIPRENFFSLSNIKEVNWSDDEGLSLSLLKPDAEIIFGSEEIDKRSKRVQNVLSYLDTQSQKARVIDSRFSKKVLVRLRKGP